MPMHKPLPRPAPSTPEYGFETLTLLDNEATLDNIVELLRFVFEDASRLESLVFYFAGHGCQTPFDNYLVTHDALTLREGLSLGELSRFADRFTASGVPVVILLDCCHAGAAVPSAVDATALTSAAIENAFPKRRSARGHCSVPRNRSRIREYGSKLNGLFDARSSQGSERRRCRLGWTGDARRGVQSNGRTASGCRPAPVCVVP